MLDVLAKILKFRQERDWSEYQLAEKSGLPQSTISSWYRKNQIPTIQSLDKICRAFNISLSQFFTEPDTPSIQLTPTQSELLNQFNKLTPLQQKSLINFLNQL